MNSKRSTSLCLSSAELIGSASSCLALENTFKYEKLIINCNSNKWLSNDMNLFHFGASDLHFNQISSDYSGVLIFNYNMQNNPWT